MGKWSSILRAGKYVIDNPATRSVGRAVTSPARSLAVSGQALKTATIGAGIGYVGWEALVNDKPVARTVADVAIGEKNVDTIVGKTTETVDDIHEATGTAVQSMNNANNALSGISDFLRSASSGEGGNMFGNFFSNIFSGNVSGMSIVGLLAAGLMIFSHTGWLGKIGGALLAMMLIGNNSKRVVEPTPQVTQTSGLKR